MSVTRPTSRPTSRPSHLHVVSDPPCGEVIRLPAGSRLEVRFARPGLGISTWQIQDRPGHVLPLAEDRTGFSFLVFGEDEAAASRPLRLVRVRPDRAEPTDVRDLTVLVTAS